MKRFFFILFLGTFAFSSSVALPVAPRTVNRTPGYNSWPMIQALGTRLICTYSRGKAHSNAESGRGAYARYSDDEGRTWSDEVTLAVRSGYGEVPIGKGLDGRGHALFWIRAMGGSGKCHELFRTCDGVAFEKIVSLGTADLNPFPQQITDIFEVPGRGLMALWFAGPYAYEGGYDAASGHSWGYALSTDGGLTWTQTTVEADLSAADWPTEQAAVYVGNGRIFGVARTDGGSRQHQLTSSDSGRTWMRALTNIDDISSSTPTLAYNPRTGLVSNYYFWRGNGMLRRRVVALDSIWSAAGSWPAAEVVGVGSESSLETGNVNLTVVGSTHYIAYYSGRKPDLGIYVLPFVAP